MAEYEPQDTGIEIRGGPIWLWIESTTYTGDRRTTPDVETRDVLMVENTITDILLLQSSRDRLEFVGELSERNIFCSKSSDITISCFIKLEEDFVSIPLLNELTEPLKTNIDAIDRVNIRAFRVASEEFIEQHHPEIIQ